MFGVGAPPRNGEHKPGRWVRQRKDLQLRLEKQGAYW